MPDLIPNTWRNADGKEVPLNELTAEQLQAAYHFSEARALQHYDKTETFTKLMDMLEQEAQRRDIILVDIDEAKASGNILSIRRIWKNTLNISKK